MEGLELKPTQKYLNLKGSKPNLSFIYSLKDKELKKEWWY